MCVVAPNYYSKFKCIADKCKHSCCIGWEIDIDEETYATYNILAGEMGERIRENIEGEPPHFILREGDRCPFLNERGLCDIILSCGEDHLCDICTLHPRFKNFYDSFEEVGLGLCCEEAARIILSDKEKFSIDTPKELTEEEKNFFAKRQKIFDTLQNREKNIGERFSELASEFGFAFSLEKLYNSYIGLERLDEAWTAKLNKIKDATFDCGFFDEHSIAFEQLASYFVFRHLADAMWDGDYTSRVRFALASCYLIGAICSCGDEIEEIARMYSSEVEYSEENTREIMESL